MHPGVPLRPAAEACSPQPTTCCMASAIQHHVYCCCSLGRRQDWQYLQQLVPAVASLAQCHTPAAQPLKFSTASCSTELLLLSRAARLQWRPLGLAVPDAACWLSATRPCSRSWQKDSSVLELSSGAPSSAGGIGDLTCQVVNGHSGGAGHKAEKHRVRIFWVASRRRSIRPLLKMVQHCAVLSWTVIPAVRVILGHDLASWAAGRLCSPAGGDPSQSSKTASRQAMSQGQMRWVPLQMSRQALQLTAACWEEDQHCVPSGCCICPSNFATSGSGGLLSFTLSSVYAIPVHLEAL